MLKKYKILASICTIFLVVILLASQQIANADMGAKPSIRIHLKNMDTSNYIIDLFENYNELKEKNEININFNEIAQNRNITVNQAKQLYNMNYDGWMSSCMRNNLLWGECAGNTNHEHYFNYFGVPSTYKVVIINNDTGETKITDIIQSNSSNSEITIDVSSMEVTQNKLAFIKNINFFLILSIVNPLILTIAVEIIVALIMKIKNVKTIFITNLITNLLLQLVLMYTSLPYIFIFIILEILVFIAEYLVYKKYFIDTPKNKILFYTIIANIISALLTFINI